MLLGEQAASKTAGWGSNPHARADCRRGSNEKGVRLAPVRLWGIHAGANPVVGSRDDAIHRICALRHLRGFCGDLTSVRREVPGFQRWKPD